MLLVGFTRAPNSFNNSLTRLHIFFRTTIHEPNHRWRLPKKYAKNWRRFFHPQTASEKKLWWKMFIHEGGGECINISPATTHGAWFFIQTLLRVVERARSVCDNTLSIIYYIWSINAARKYDGVNGLKESVRLSCQRAIPFYDSCLMRDKALMCRA